MPSDEGESGKTVGIVVAGLEACVAWSGVKNGEIARVVETEAIGALAAVLDCGSAIGCVVVVIPNDWSTAEPAGELRDPLVTTSPMSPATTNIAAAVTAMRRARSERAFAGDRNEAVNDLYSVQP